MLSRQLNHLNNMVRPNGKVFFGWYIVGAAGGIQMLSGLLWMQSYGAYVVLLQAEFGWSKALVAGAFALTRIESGILGPLQGWLVDRYGPRPILRIGIVVFGCGFILFSQIDSLLTFYLTFALIAVGSSLGGFATVMVSLVNWFSRHRAKAISISQVGYSVGGLCVPIVVLCLEAFGWRTTAMISGFVVLIVGLPLVQVVKHRPTEIGETADGVVEKPVSGSGQSLFSDRDFTAREAMRTHSFWLISLGHACALLTVSAVMVHLVPHLTGGLNFTLGQAALVVALMTGFQMLGQLMGGYLGDRINKRFICFGCMVFHTLALVLVAFATDITMVIVFAVLHGLAWGIRGPLMVAIRADYFGPSSFGTIMGFSSLIVMLGMSTGPIFAGYMADIYGNYEKGFSYLALGAFLGSFCFLAATPPKQLRNHI
ncbi:MAG TPA: MFS transporter [Pseudomonadales bacterium]|nr:MFS transporter [Pseudomonadales bacterium]